MRQARQGENPPRGILGRRVNEDVDVLGKAVVAVDAESVAADERVLDASFLEVTHDVRNVVPGSWARVLRQRCFSTMASTSQLSRSASISSADR
jgi:hypothetical protein